MEQVGIKNILTKRFGSNNAMNVSKATIKGLSELQDAVSIANKRGLTIKEILIKAMVKNKIIKITQIKSSRV